ncbi:MAG: hypothetical protein HY781_11205 [Chloroflexi bacterium]|nr:hypothetical protein [Chloroflexota bacterium]
MKIKTILLFGLICTTLLAGCALPPIVPTELPLLPLPGFTPQPGGEPPPGPGGVTDNFTLMLLYGLIAFLAVIAMFAFLALLNRWNKPRQ